MIKEIVTHIKKIVRGGGIKMFGVYTFTLTNINTGERTVHVYKNLIPTTARALIASHLTNPTPGTALLATYAAVGTNTTAPNNTDVKLGTEIYRNLIASRTSAGNIGFITAFFTAPEAVGTLKEAGIFMGGSGAANSGTLLSHVAVDITKSNIQTLTLDWTITIN